MWSQVIVNYDKFALWGISHWGKKQRQFYAFATTRESARDVYSKRRIITVTKVEMVEWHDYKHLDLITIRRDDDVLYKFKEGDFHRLRIQDIEDMLLLLVQGKVTNLNVEERPTFELMKGTCKSLTELDYFCEEVYKATTEKLEWINPEGRQYPHDLRQPLPLVLNSQGRRVIPFHHFINNDLEYLRGGVSSRKYSTSVTKTTTADYGYIKWIEDLVPNSMWSQTIVKYDKFAL
ncbi:hypothetical protein Tco_0056226 [Tanacetum coccineum]